MFDLSVSRDMWAYLAFAASVFIVIFGLLAWRIRNNRALRSYDQQAFFPQQSATRPVQLGSSTPKMANAVRTAISKAEIFASLKLVAAMAAYGPITDTAKHGKNFQKVSVTAASFMNPGVYSMFVSVFRRAVSIDEDNPMDIRPLDQVTGYPLDDLANRDDVLAIMVAYVHPIIEFYRLNAQENTRFAAEFLGDDTMNGTFAKLRRIHNEFYAH